MAVLKVTISILSLMIAAFVSLRFLGLSQKYQEYDHPLMKKPTPWVLAWGGDSSEGPSHGQIAIQAASNYSNTILALDIRLNKEKHFYAVSQEFVNKNQLNILEMTDHEVKSIDLGDGEHPLSLEEILLKFSKLPLFFWVRDNVENIDLRLEPILKKHLAQSKISQTSQASQISQVSQIMIHSDYDNVLKSVKSLIPNLLYGTGVGQRVRILMLSSLWLEPIATIDGDFWVSPLKGHGVVSVPELLKQELSRRKKHLIVGPLLNPKDNDEAMLIEPSGYLTAFPKDLINKLEKRN